MNKTAKIILFASLGLILLAFLAIGLINRIRDIREKNYDYEGRACCSTYEKPVEVEVFYTAEELRRRDTITFLDKHPLKKPGKIYTLGNLLLVNELLEGVHIYDNSNPKKPIYKQFVRIPGNVDIAAQGNLLIADYYTDIVAIDLLQKKVLFRKNDIIPISQIATTFREADRYNEILKGYDTIYVTQTVNCGDCMIIGTRAAIGMGAGGSMARFAFDGSLLHVLTEEQLITMSVDSGFHQLAELGLPTGRGVAETIFPQDSHLYIGSTTGMMILGMNGRIPYIKSTVQHFTSCDPIVVENDMAYVTLRSSSKRDCGFRAQNELQIYDISDREKPMLLLSEPMMNPHGLAVHEGKAYVCEGDSGLVVLDVSNPVGYHDENNEYTNIELLFMDKDKHAYDVILNPYNKTLILVGRDGLSQYDLKNMKRLSEIELDS